MRQRHVSAASALALLLSLGCAPAQAKLNYDIHIVDDAHAATDLYAQVIGNVGAAMDDWGRYLQGSAHISVQVNVSDTVPAAAAASISSGYVGQAKGYDVYESGMAHEISTGLDVTAGAPDIQIWLNPVYARDELWFDPTPASRLDAVPIDKTDALSIFIHEVGHALAFNGWGGHDDGKPPANYASTWDILTKQDGSFLYFVGGAAVSLYGGAVPITQGNNFHIGNVNGPGEDLLADVMNGAMFYRGHRYEISPLDLAMVQDMGIAVTSLPETSTSTMLLVGLLMLTTQGRRMKKRQMTKSAAE